ncbi:MAG: hypothetical protein ABI949_16365 [Ilumatobacteraceae bacterium]
MTIADLQAVATDTSRPVRIQPNHRRLRVLVGGTVIADTTKAMYLFEQGHLPTHSVMTGAEPGVGLP